MSILVCSFILYYKNTQPSPITPEPYFTCPDGSHHGPGIPNEGIEEWCRENTNREQKVAGIKLWPEVDWSKPQTVTKERFISGYDSSKDEVWGL